jgi:hypothetical protein
MFKIKLIFKLDLAVRIRYLVISRKGILLVFLLFVVWPHRLTAQTKIRVTPVDGVSCNFGGSYEKGL